MLDRRRRGDVGVGVALGGGDTVALSPSKVALFARRHSFTTMAAGSTTVAYQPVAGCEYVYTNTRLESAVQAVAPAAFTFSKFAVQGAANSLSSANVVQRFRKNGANGNQVVTLTPGQYLFTEDATNTDSVAANDTFTTTLALSSAAGTGTYTPCATRVVMEMTDTTDHWMMYRGFGGTFVLAGSGACYWAIMGYNGDPRSSQVLQAWARVKWRCDATVESFSVPIQENSMSVDVTFYLVKNGSNVMSGTMSAGSLSRVVFTGGPITLADGDTVDMECSVGAGTGQFIVGEIEMWTKTSRATPQAMQIANHAIGNNVNVAGPWTLFFGISGSSQPSGQTTRGPVALVHGFAGKASKASVYIRSSTGAGITSTFYYEVAGVASSVGVTIPALGSGWYDDTSGATATWAAADECVWKGTRTATGAINICTLSCVEEYVSG